MRESIEIRPYVWSGPYAEWRAAARHDPGLCADLRAPWMAPGERLIVRACEIGPRVVWLWHAGMAR